MKQKPFLLCCVAMKRISQFFMLSTSSAAESLSPDDISPRLLRYLSDCGGCETYFFSFFQRQVNDPLLGDLRGDESSLARETFFSCQCLQFRFHNSALGLCDNLRDKRPNFKGKLMVGFGCISTNNNNKLRNEHKTIINPRFIS